MKKTDLLLYEAPTISEFVSIPVLQTVIGWFLMRKIEKKWKRYQKRIARANWIEYFKKPSK